MSRLLRWGGAIILVIGFLIAYLAYRYIFVSQVYLENGDNGIIYIPKNADFESVCDSLINKNCINNINTFKGVARLMKYQDKHVKSGKYKLVNGMNNKSLISLLRSGRQEAVNVTFNNVRNFDELAGRIAKNIEIDSIELIDFLKDSENAKEYGYNTKDWMTMFIPNTYQMYWNIEVNQLIDRLRKEHSIFWTKERIAKAKKIGLSKEEVYILASIVDKETLLKSEKKRVAGVYMNRLKKGILLQADPTVVFAANDFTIRRVLNKHLEIDSPYNTYKYAGLPPGPICMASIDGIDAVLNYEKHNYLYFCADPNRTGGHNFAKTLVGHNQNARKYKQWLNSRGIKK